jgi:hypothetical protein
MMNERQRSLAAQIRILSRPTAAHPELYTTGSNAIIASASCLIRIFVLSWVQNTGRQHPETCAHFEKQDKILGSMKRQRH